MSAVRGQGKGGFYLAVAACVVVVAALVGAIQVMGTPAQQRLLRLDERRVEDLRELARVINAYHDAHDALPASLAFLDSQPGQDLSIADPASAKPYRYEPGKGGKYRLCAIFATDSARSRTAHWTPSQWRHGAGEHCFALPVDKNAEALRGMIVD
jgi:hypothetical protein